MKHKNIIFQTPPFILDLESSSFFVPGWILHDHYSLPDKKIIAGCLSFTILVGWLVEMEKNL